jgi:hypothetical protein
MSDVSGPVLQVASAVSKVKTPHYKTLLLVGLLMGVGVYSLWLLHVEPFAGILQPYMLAVTGFVKDIGAGIVNLVNMGVKYTMSQPLPAVVGGITMLGTVYGIFSKVAGDRALAKTQALASEQIQQAHADLLDLSQQHGIAQTKIGSLQEELDAYKNDTSFQEAQTMIGSLKTQVSQKEATVQELTHLIEDLKTKTTVMVH